MHFHERSQTGHGGMRSYSGTKKTLQAAGQLTRATRRGTHREAPAHTLAGDEAPPRWLHSWVPDCQGDLIGTLDDATSEIYSAFFVEEEGTLSSFRGLQEVIETKGLFWHTDEAEGRVDKTRLTRCTVRCSK